MIRHGSLYAETIDVKRTFMHPYYKYPLNYNDIALSELGRRVIFDLEKYGDSPMCLGQNIIFYFIYDIKFDKGQVFLEGP